MLLAIVLLSDRVRLHTRRFVSRHFQRPLYDYRTVWRRFTEGTASCVKQADLCQAAVKLVADIFQVLSVTLWLVDDKRENLVFAASTFLSEARAKRSQTAKRGCHGSDARLWKSILTRLTLTPQRNIGRRCSSAAIPTNFAKAGTAFVCR